MPEKHGNVLNWPRFDRPTVTERRLGFERDGQCHTVAEWPRQDAVLVFADGTALHVRNVRAVVDVAERFPIGADLWGPPPAFVGGHDEVTIHLDGYSRDGEALIELYGNPRVRRTLFRRILGWLDRH